MLVHDRLYDELFQLGADSRFEVHNGKLREKPSMSYRHGRGSFYLGLQLGVQLDPALYEVRVNGARVRQLGLSYYIPDVMVFPRALLGPEVDRADLLEIYDAALPFVGEVWSPSTGDYDVEEKFPVYMDRGDQVVWRLHPFDRQVRSWERQANGLYVETVYDGDEAPIPSLPNVVIDLKLLFD